MIGGKDVKREKEIIETMNILICTPGRLLQHMDETASFSGDNLQILVMDEVDRLLDMGFKDTIDQIFRNLPEEVQTLMISATVSKKISNLAALNLKKEQEFVSIHDYDKAETAEGEEAATTSIVPVKLLHYYMELKIEDKLDTLFSFLKAHPKSKVIVFFSARKQVRFAYQAFKSLKIG